MERKCQSGANNINGKHLYIASLFLTAALVMPVAMMAAAALRRANVSSKN
jgi:hypothetical protein